MTTKKWVVRILPEIATARPLADSPPPPPPLDDCSAPTVAAIAAAERRRKAASAAQTRPVRGRRKREMSSGESARLTRVANSRSRMPTAKSMWGN